MGRRTVKEPVESRMANVPVNSRDDRREFTGFFGCTMPAAFASRTSLRLRMTTILMQLLCAEGRHPVTEEDGEVAVVFNGELFDPLEKRAKLAARGHRLVKHCDTEISPHFS